MEPHPHLQTFTTGIHPTLQLSMIPFRMNRLKVEGRGGRTRSDSFTRAADVTDKHITKTKRVHEPRVSFHPDELKKYT